MTNIPAGMIFGDGWIVAAHGIFDQPRLAAADGSATSLSDRLEFLAIGEIRP
jgi:hypothetical protein